MHRYWNDFVILIFKIFLLQETVLPEKLGDLIKAKAQLEQLMKNTYSVEEQQIAQSLANIFERTNRYDNLDAVTLTI